MKAIKIIISALIFTGTMYGQVHQNIEVNPKSGAFAVDSVQINAPVDKVYALLCDIDKWPLWFEGISETHIEGVPDEGKNFKFKAKGYNINSTIHTVQPSSGIGWTGKMLWIKAVHNWYFQSLSNTTTLVITKESFNGFWSPMLKSSMKKDIRSDLLILKKAAEGRALK